MDRGGASGDIWVCPRCHGPLRPEDGAVACSACGTDYRIVAGIPDFRLGPTGPDGRDEEYARVRELGEAARELSAEEVLHRHFSSRPTWSDREARSRTAAIVEGPERLRRERDGWLRPCLPEDGPVLDLGCGAGQLLVALGRAGRGAVGVDLSLDLLVIAGAFLREAGLRAELAAGQAEALPLATGSLPSVVSLDVIEHVADPVPYLREIDRVLAPDGALALSTPNRFSLGAEPHVSVWGVGWLPRRFQRDFAEARSGKSYAGVQLLSLRELRGLVEEHTSLAPQVLVPSIPEEEIARFPAYRARLARTYNRLLGSGLFRRLIRPVAPFYRARAFGERAAPSPRPGTGGGEA